MYNWLVQVRDSGNYHNKPFTTYKAAYKYYESIPLKDDTSVLLLEVKQEKYGQCV